MPFVMKSLPTFYGGVEFRSRMEARWAVYFDYLKIDWIYEPEGFSLPSGNYCVDFGCNLESKIPYYCEVKPNEEEANKVIGKLKELSEFKKAHVYCLVGNPSLKSQRSYFNGSASCGGMFCHYAFIRKDWGVPFVGDMDYDPQDEDIECVQKAKNYRFEKGIAERVSDKIEFIQSPVFDAILEAHTEKPNEFTKFLLKTHNPIYGIKIDGKVDRFNRGDSTNGMAWKRN